MMQTPSHANARLIARTVLAIAYLAAGILHLTIPAPFLSITPGWVPWPETVVRLTGLAEVAGAVGLFTPRLRTAAAIGLALYAVCVFPANIKHALDDLGTAHAPLARPVLGWAYHAPRLLLQPVIVWWALWGGAGIDWPFRKRR